MAIPDKELLQFALIGYRSRVAEIEALLAGNSAVTTMPDQALQRKGRRTMSPAAKERIAAVQKERWAKFHAAKRAPTKKAPVKKPMSAARKKSLFENLARARAAKAAKRKAA